MKAVPINAPSPHGASFNRVDCKKIHCSWHRPCRTVWLNFGNREVAKKACDRFNSGMYKVLDEQVTTSGPKESPSSGNSWSRNPLAWTLILTDVPAMASKAEITKHIPAAFQPRHVELGKKSYDVHIGEANDVIKSKFTEIGPLEWWQDATELGGKRAKAKARFADENDARHAVEVLNGTALPFNQSGKLTMQLIHSSRVKISERIYGAVRDKIDEQRQGWLSEHLLFIPFDAVGGFRVLKIEGEDRNKVARAKATLENILDGQIAAYDGRTLWDPSLRTNGNLYVRVKELETTLGIVIVRNKRQSRLEVYGQAQKVDEAQRLLAELIQRDSSHGKTIELDRQQFKWACQGGFKLISSAIGDRAVTFDVVSNPKRIIVTGSESQYQTAMRMVTERKQFQLIKTDDSDEKDCAICWTEAEDPVRTSCNHIYCTDCFQDFCFSGATGESDLYVRCEGDSSRCMSVLPLPELQEKLPSSVFEDLLEAAFKSYVRHRPQEFSYCPTPDCVQVYRISSTLNPSTFTCPSCLVAICTKCQASHPGITCADYEDIASGRSEAFELAKEALGIKDCPKCKTHIEKTYGCNHITCGGCQTHICWFCMATFNEAGSCYGHMSKEHASII